MIRKFLLPVLFLSMLRGAELLAGVRHFGFLYEAPTSAPGSFELENTMTWKRTSDPERADELSFRHEIEIGITDRFQASIYFADWAYTDDGHESKTEFTDVALELIYNFTNPVLDPVGISFYQEIKGGDELIEWESKLIAQKNFGPWTFVYNATLEAVWEGPDLEEREGEFTNSVGVSYEFSPRFSAGVELLHEFVFPEWRDEESVQNVFVGPNVCYRRNNWFVTVAVLAQATSTPDEADVQVRTIFGMGL